MQTVTLARREELARQISALSRRDLQLWSIASLVMLVLVSGILSFLLPNVTASVKVEIKYLPQLSLGLIALVVLLNFYLIEQRREVNRKERELIRQLALAETVEQFAVIDPVTNIFNRRFLDDLVPRELKRAEREETPITFIMVHHQSLGLLIARYGSVIAEHFVDEVAQLLQRNFRGTDTLIRYNESQFLVVMPDTTEEQSQFALARLMERVDRWNAESGAVCQLELRFTRGEYRSGQNVWQVIEHLQQRADDPAPVLAKQTDADAQPAVT